MRTLWFAGATCGMAIMFGIYSLLGRAVASGVLLTITVVAVVMVVREFRQSRRLLKQFEDEAAKLAYYKETGRWPTML